MSKSSILKEKEYEVIEFLKERAYEQQSRYEDSKNKKVSVLMAKEQLFLEKFEEVVNKAFKSLPKPKLSKSKNKNLKIKRVLNVVISDTHYGSNLNPLEVGHSYGPVEEARRTASICKQVADYKRQYRDETELNVHLIGDLINGSLHDARDGAPLAEQVAAAMRILSQALQYFSINFKKIKVFCATGNHGRQKSRHQQRAINEKFDSIETMIFYALKQFSTFLPNVDVSIGYSPEYTWESFGAVGYATHGDTQVNFGYPGKSVNTESISRQVDKINNARIMKGEKPVSVIMIGHVHVGTMTHLNGGTVAITNGCLIPPDAYAKSITITSTKCGQWLFESSPGHMVGDARFMEVNFETDKDKTLDSIIQPYAGL